MIVDHRTYDFHPGRLPGWLALYERAGLPLQRRHLGTLVGLFTVEVGELNRVVFMWGYADMDDRTRRRAAMEADDAWSAFRRESDGMGAIRHMANRLLVTQAISPVGAAGGPTRIPGQLVDQRIYSFRPGTIGPWLERFTAVGLPLQRKYLGGPTFYALGEVGRLNQIVWAVSYDGLGERARRRAAMEADPEWQAYKRVSAGLGALTAQEDALLVPVPFTAGG